MKDIISNPVMGKNTADILTALSKCGFTTDISNLLQQVGLSGKIDDASTTPLKDLASKGDVKDVVAMTEKKVSADPQKDMAGRSIAGAIIDKTIADKRPEVRI